MRETTLLPGDLQSVEWVTAWTATHAQRGIVMVARLFGIFGFEFRFTALRTAAAAPVDALIVDEGVFTFGGMNTQGAPVGTRLLVPTAELARAVLSGHLWSANGMLPKTRYVFSEEYQLCVHLIEQMRRRGERVTEMLDVLHNAGPLGQLFLQSMN